MLNSLEIKSLIEKLNNSYTIDCFTKPCHFKEKSKANRNELTYRASFYYSTTGASQVLILPQSSKPDKLLIMNKTPIPQLILQTTELHHGETLNQETEHEHPHKLPYGHSCYFS